VDAGHPGTVAIVKLIARAPSLLRWTDGDAAVPADLFAGFTGKFEFVVQVAMTSHYLDEGEVQRVA
jgi:hypothetical protein